MAGNSLWQIFPPSKRECWLGWPEREMEYWRFFEKGGDIYCETVARMFHCRVEKAWGERRTAPERKTGDSVLRYGGSVGALKAMGAGGPE